MKTTRRTIACAIALGAIASTQQAQEKPIDWQVGGEIRARYELLDGQFRANGTGGDQGYFMRSLLHLKAVNPNWTAGLEIHDSRSYLTDSDTPLSTSYINTFDILQAYLELPMRDFMGSEYDGSFKLGRQTLSIGSKRQVERVDFANVIFSYTGAYLNLKNPRGDEWHAFVISPVERLPNDFDDLLDNKQRFDEEEFNRIFWGLHYRKANAFPGVLADIWGELFIYGLHEWDAFGNETPNRQYLTPGFRLYRKEKPGEWNFDIEGALRYGQRRATNSPDDERDLDVLATMLLLKVGYTFDHPWKPNIAAQYYWASGDRNPDDGKYDQYERLFGGRRTDLNNTSLFGPLTPANLSAPGVRFEMKPTDQSTFRLTYSAAFLASDTDSFIVGRQRDPSGQSGSFIGHVIDSRYTYQFTEHLGLESGASYFSHGGFTRNNPKAPEADHTSFAYSQLTFTF